MKIILNGREEEFDNENISVSRMLQVKKFSFRMRIIKINGLLIAKDQYDATFINEGDKVEMLYLMSGG